MRCTICLVAMTGRSDKTVCSNPCRQAAYRNRLARRKLYRRTRGRRKR